MPRLVISYPVGCPPGPSAVSAISLDMDGGTIGDAGGVDCSHPCCDLVFKYGKQLKDGL